MIYSDDNIYRIRIVVNSNGDFEYDDIRPNNARGYLYFSSYKEAILYMRKHINRLIESFTPIRNEENANKILIVARNISDYLSLINVSTSNFNVGEEDFNSYSLFYEIINVHVTEYEKFFYFEEVN